VLKVTLKGLRAHKTRFISTFLAVLLGISFLAGMLVLTDTIKQSFDDLFASVNQGTDALVRSTEVVSGVGAGDEIRQRLDDSLVDTVAGVDGVKAAEPGISTNFTQIVGSNGKALGNPGRGAPTLGGNWIGTTALNPFKIAEGRPPESDDEVVIDRGSSKKGDLHVGDKVTILVPTGAPRKFTISGIATFGTADSPLGATYSLFTLKTAQEVLAEPGRIDEIRVQAESGVSQAEVTAAIKKVLPENTEALTGEQITKENQSDIQKGIGPVSAFFTSFAVVAVIVGAFVIFNTFSIIVAQRARETALLRAIGASRAQVLRSVVGEAAVVGVLASAVGVAFGIVVAYALKAVFRAFGFDLPTSGLTIKPSTLITGLVVGLLVTVASALWPAFRGSRVPPIAAMRDVAFERPALSKGRVITGAVFVALGVVEILNGSVGSAGIGAVGLGALLVLTGTIVLGPIFAAPVGRILGKPVEAAKGVTGNLAKENASRNPRRTSATASALLVGVGVVALLTVLYGSFKKTIDDQISRSFAGDLSISAGGFGGGGLSPALQESLAQTPEVGVAASLRFGRAEVNGSGINLTGVAPQDFTKVIDLDVRKGDLAELGDDGIAVLDTKADDEHLAIGKKVTMRFAETGTKPFVVRAIFHRNDVSTAWIISNDAYAANIPNPVDSFIFVKFAEGVSNADGRAAVEAAAKPYPNATVQDQNELKQTFESSIQQVFAFLLVLLLLAIVIALLGIANTLRLSIYERTREIGLLRAVGMTQPQVRASIRWESAIIAVFGTIGGLVVGIFFGWAITEAAGKNQHVTFAPPPFLLAFLLILGAAAGVIAAIRPARRAARLNMLTAIASE
jgi:putative ABC transport system permease protein